ncbi:aspartate kinase [Aquabacter spiritensis]|nr:aspartate kinase [Aquabacter spiritensis]
MPPAVPAPSAPPTPGTIVVKLGGSLAGAPDLFTFTAQFATRDDVVIVPGGGPFADAVRHAEGPLRLSRGACHRMAILGMEQMAHALRDIAPALRPLRTLDEVRRHRAGLWFPATELLGADDIEESWDVTSDSLACWLARRIGAARVVLVKAPGAVPPMNAAAATSADIAGWTRSGRVDGAFAAYAAAFGGPVHVIAADDAAGIARLFGPLPRRSAA